MPTLWDRLWDPETVPTYWLTRFAILRLLGLVYFIAFWTLVHQGLPLLGTHGLLPVATIWIGLRRPPARPPGVYCVLPACSG